MKNWLFIFTFFLTISPFMAQAQIGLPGSRGGRPAQDQVELLPPRGADSLVVMNQPGFITRKLIGNVKLRHKGVLLFCDVAIQNQTTNVIEAYGHVRLIQGDSITVRGDTMLYYGNNRQANLRGRTVTLTDRKMTLTTTQLNYDLAAGRATYPVKGRVVDKENILTSLEGDYYTAIKEFQFRRDVKLVNPKYTLTTESLLYNTQTKQATFQGPTKIVNKDGTIFAKEGQYNTVSRVSNFQQRATVETPKYQLTGDSLYYDNASELGIAKGNVVMIAKEDKKENKGRTIITGQHARYNGKAGVSRVTGKALVRSAVGDRDTLYMRADTLFAFDDPSLKPGEKPAEGKKKVKKLVGQKNVVVYKSDLQSRCDSLVYDVADSVIYFYKKPIVWSQNYQMEADSMTAKMKHNRIQTMYLRTKSFVVSEDTLRNFNQVKGRVVTAYFESVAANPKAVTAVVGAKGNPNVEEKTVLDRVVVEGNGQSIYFAVDEKNKLVGLNHVECARMLLNFENSQVEKIKFYGRPDAQFVPPQEFTEEKKQLDGFRWRTDEKPSRTDVVQYDPARQPVPKKAPKLQPFTKPSAIKAVLNEEK
jgi:lipopolysaccharide export system protein LptA